MEPTTREKGTRPAEQQEQLPFGDNGLSADPKLSLPPMTEYSAQVASPATPVWLQRMWLVVYVVFCIELGLLLAVLPWYKQVWDNNALLANLPTLREALHNNFVRGLISGLGLIDIWLGISEAVHYRDRRGPAPPTAT
ncbi:MAG: hypothetical protein ACE14L_00085 [Terriglobales bacterium]